MKDMDKLDDLETGFLHHIDGCFGREKAISRPSMAVRLGITPRDVQDVYDRLVMDHHVPVLSYDGKGGGYCYPSEMEVLARAEIEAVCRRMTRRAFRQLYHQSVLKRSSFAEEAVQMSLGLEDEYRKREAERLGVEDLEITVPDEMNVIKQVFSEVAQHPAKYKDELAYAHKKLGGILLTNEVAEGLLKLRRLIDQVIPPTALSA